MCGINGIYGLKDSFIATAHIKKMNMCMRHRGPDDEGVYSSDKIALGHRRLSIIDLSTAGHQPMYSLDKRYHLIYNGELYNYKELRSELRSSTSISTEQPYSFQTNTDSEVILAAYERWGINCLTRFNGMFAFAIWDDKEKELFIARDRLGIKPLYYSYIDNILIFSSEIRSLLSSGLIPRQLNESALIDYLSYQTVHAPETIIKGVKMLMPGHFLKVKNDKTEIQCYWHLGKHINHTSKGKTYPDVCRDINRLLTEAVEKRLIADVPFGAFLSGGIDSSVIVALMSKVSNEKIKTFSVTFNESEFSEAKYAEIIANKFNTEHHEIKLNPEDFLKELPNALKAMDHPSGDGPNTYIVSKSTKKAGITMALSGLGGDELFAGYDVFKTSLKINQNKFFNSIPKFIREAGGNFLIKIKPGIYSEKIAAFFRKNKVNSLSYYPLSRQVLMDYQISEITNIPIEKNKVEQILEGFDFNSYWDSNTNFQLSTISILEMSTYMSNVLLRDTDQMSMADALEVRVPFLDYSLVEYVLGVPDKYKNTNSPKKLLVDAMSDLLPQEIVNRPKMGFTLPWKNWMKNELHDFCEKHLIALSKRNMFNENGVLKLWNDFLKGNPHVTWSRIWILVVLENWMTENQISS